MKDTKSTVETGEITLIDGGQEIKLSYSIQGALIPTICALCNKSGYKLLKRLLKVLVS